VRRVRLNGDIVRKIIITAAGLAIVGLSVGACSAAAHAASPASAMPAVTVTQTRQAAPAASRSPNATSTSSVITAPTGSAPVLHPGDTVLVNDFSQDGSVATPESQTWKLTSASYLTASQVTQYVDEGELTQPKTGDRYLGLGLTIKYLDNAPGNSNFTLNNAQFGWATPAGNSGLTSAQFPADGIYGSYFGGMNSMRAGQSTTGYVVFEVPGTPVALVALSSDSQATPLVIIDPERLISASVCSNTAKNC
jgi:hypothetical protein